MSGDMYEYVCVCVWSRQPGEKSAGERRKFVVERASIVCTITTKTDLEK